MGSLAEKHATLRFRAEVMASVRSFFRARDYVEVDTPVRVTLPALEDHIDPEPSGQAWLRTSPELHMKRMVCEGYERIVQLGPCFRQGERGERHLPEYTMLEWYRTGATSNDLMKETSELLSWVVDAVNGCTTPGVDPAAEPMVMTVSEAFWLWAGWDPVEAFDDDRFDLDLTEKIEPMVAEQPCPVILKDFPIARGALARAYPDRPKVADRWELYLGGLELANAYRELTDPVEQRQRFEACARGRRDRGQTIWEADPAFLQAIEKGMPDCSGIALGLDRLVMVLAGKRDIADVVAFPEDSADGSSTLPPGV